MKKMLILLAVAGISLALFAGCAQSGAGDAPAGISFSPVAAFTVADAPSYSGTGSVPDSETESAPIEAEIDSLNDLVESSSTAESVRSAVSRAVSRVAYPVNETIDLTVGAKGTGTITVTGTVQSSDDPSAMPVISMDDILTTYTDCCLTGSSYTVNGYDRTRSYSETTISETDYSFSVNGKVSNSAVYSVSGPNGCKVLIDTYLDYSMSMSLLDLMSGDPEDPDFLDNFIVKPDSKISYKYYDNAGTFVWGRDFDADEIKAEIAKNSASSSGPVIVE